MRAIHNSNYEPSCNFLKKNLAISYTFGVSRSNPGSPGKIVEWEDYFAMLLEDGLSIDPQDEYLTIL